MKYQYGDLMDHLSDYRTVFITTNAFIKNNGELVMGRGIARACAKRFPTLPVVAAARISGGLYGLIPDVYVEEYDPALYGSSDQPQRIAIGLFQVKFNWWDNASLELVEHSTRMLSHLAKTEAFIPENPTMELRYAVNYPAIGNGHLSKADVEPIIETMPDNVDVWQFPSNRS